MQNPSEQNAWSWPADLDAIIAAPNHHKLLLENEQVRILDTCIMPGERTAIHTHQYPAALYIVSWSEFIRYDDKGNIMLDSRKLEKQPSPEVALWSAALEPHALENIGNSKLHVISVELKQ